MHCESYKISLPRKSYFEHTSTSGDRFYTNGLTHIFYLVNYFQTNKYTNEANFIQNWANPISQKQPFIVTIGIECVYKPFKTISITVGITGWIITMLRIENRLVHIIWIEGTMDKKSRTQVEA